MSRRRHCDDDDWDFDELVSAARRRKEPRWEDDYHCSREPEKAPKEDCCPYVAGPQGKQGPAGRDGERGERGPQGPEGCKGASGRDGRDGDPGPAGPTGPQGQTGTKGADGEDGKSCEVRGFTNPEGDQLTVEFLNDGTVTNTEVINAPKGETGATGPQGLTGPTGSQGLTGATGPQGLTGPKGDTGAIGATGAKGDKGDPGARGADGARGPSGVQGCTFNEDTNCYDVVLNLEDGSQKTAQFGGCVTLLACGFSGTPICPTGAAVTFGDVDQDSAEINVDYTIAGGTLTSQFKLNDTIQSATTTVSNPRFENGQVCFDVQTTGKLDISQLFDKTGLPQTPQGCTSPFTGNVEINGVLVGSGQPTQINKTTGGAVDADGWGDVGGNNFNILQDNAQWADRIPRPRLFGGIPGSLIGNNFGYIVDTFGDNVQTFTVCEDVCYYEPIEYETDLSGNPIAGTGVDSSGNPYTGEVTDLLTGDTVTV